MGKKTFGNGFILGLVAAIGLAVAGKAVATFCETTPFGRTVEYKLHKDVENKINLLQDYVDQYYLDEVDEEALKEGAYAGYIEAINDPYSTYYTKQEYEDLLESSSGEYCGIGVAVTQDTETKLITVVMVYDDTPAQKAGMKNEDILYKVEGEEIAGEEVDNVVTKIKGQEGTTVKITVYRPSTKEYIDMEVERATIVMPTIEYKMLDEENKIGYIQISQFDANTDEIFSDAMNDLMEQGMKSVVFDVRNNPGGIYDTVCNMLDELLPEGTLVYTLDKNGNKEEEKSDENCIDIPMVVLINGNSASASEIFAGAIQDFEAGTIVGTQSFGKGVVQSVFSLEDGTALKLTISKYYTPNGVNIHGKGITPDVEVEAAEVEDGEDEVSDPQMEKALEILRK